MLWFEMVSRGLELGNGDGGVVLSGSVQLKRWIQIALNGVTTELGRNNMLLISHFDCGNFIVQ